MCHNETTNIWSHLSGVILFVLLIFYIIFWVGGMEFTRPLDTLIDKFDFVNFKFSALDSEMSNSHKDSETYKKLKVNTSAEEYLKISRDLWHESVEMENPTYFNLSEEDLKIISESGDSSILSYQTQASLEAQLYDTSLDYLLLIIQKFSQGKLGP